MPLSGSTCLSPLPPWQVWVQVLYPQSNPEIAHIDAFPTLWQESLIVGIWGAVWSSIPVFILVVRMRRRASSERTLPVES
jgi:hypothetical protein